MAHYGKRTKKEQLHTDTAFKAICCRILKEKLKGKFTHGEQALLWKQDCWAQPQQFGIKVSILCRRDLRLLSCKRCRDYRMAAQQRKAMLWHDLLPVAISAKGSAQPITALPGGLSRCVGAQPQVSPCPRLCWEKCSGFAPAQAVKATWPWQQRSPACSTMSPRPGKERWHQGKWCHRQRSRKTAVTWGQDCQFYLFPASCHAQVMKWRGRRDIKEIWIMLPPCPKDTKSNL